MPSPETTAPARRRWPAASALARSVGWLAVTVFALLSLAWLTLHWAILPHIDRWRPLIEEHTSSALGVPVRIGSIQMRSSGLRPSIELRDVTVLDAQQRPALQLQRVVASISPRSLLASASSLELTLSQLLIEGPLLEVRRDAKGRLFVAGIDFSAPSDDSEPAAADWFFRQHEFAIRGGTLRWSDELRGAPPLVLSDVDLVVRNSLRRHRMRLDATPPQEWGERLSVRGDFRQSLLARGGDWRHWSGQAYADLPRADASQLRRYVDLPFELSEGVGALRAWLDLHEGAASGITADIALRSVVLRLESRLEPLVVEQLQGRFTGRRLANGASVSLRQFGFVIGEGLVWPAGDLDLSWKRGDDGAISGGEFSAGRLDLALMAQTATRLPLGEAMRTLLAQARPRGIVSDFKAAWDGPLDAPEHYRVSTRSSGLAVDAEASTLPGAIGRPGLHNAAIDLTATDKGGQATLRFKDGAVDLPGVFDEPVVALDEASARLQWHIERRAGAEPALTVELADAHVANADAKGELTATWRSGAGQGFGRGGRFPGSLELNGRLDHAVASRGARYLPLGLPEAVRHYVQHAVLGGNVRQASFRIKGDLADFPFYGSQPGEFRIAIAAEDMTLAYVPAEGEAATASPWPPLTHLGGELVIDKGSLEFRDARARVYGVELEAIRGAIRNVSGRPLLTVETQARGPLADMLRFVDATPVGGWLHGALHEATASAGAGLKLSLALPLTDLSRSTVAGSLQLAGNDLRLRYDLPLLAGARGRVDFTHQGLAIVGASARMLGGETSLEGGTQPDGSLRLAVQGSASADELRRASELPALARLAASLSGQTSYRFLLGVVKGQTEFTLTSDLVGLGSSLPEPLRKAPETALPLRVQTALAPAGAASASTAQDTLRIDLGSIVHAQFQRELPDGDEPHVLRGGIGIFEPAPTPASGVAARINLPSLDVSAWDAAASRLLPAAAADADGNAAAAYFPTRLGLTVQELKLGGRKLTHLVAGVTQFDGQWRGNIDADQLNGYIEYRAPAAAGASPGRVHARLARLSLPRSEAEEVAALLDEQPVSVPALDIVVEDFELRGKHLGRFEVQAVNRTAPEREWQLTRLSLSMAEAQLSATGRWAATGAAAGPRTGGATRRRSEFQFQLDLADSGALLKRLGVAGAIRGGKGRMKGQVAWLGSPLTPDFAGMGGQFNVAIESGQFLHADPGAARLLGVLSLQSLARRLTLDFRDVFEEGFAFDSVTGDVTIAQGVASTNNLVMRGVQAAVLMEGSADIERETQDLRVVVVPEINAGAAALAYAVINPAIGLGTFLAQLFLREPLIQASTREFRVTGSWTDPQVESVERKAGQALPKVPAPPASAASSPTH